MKVAMEFNSYRTVVARIRIYIHPTHFLRYIIYGRHFREITFSNQCIRYPTTLCPLECHAHRICYLLDQHLVHHCSSNGTDDILEQTTAIFFFD